MRKPSLTGIYFKSAPTLLAKQIESCFKSDIGPGEIPAFTSKNSKTKAIITPFHNYELAGPCAAWGYKALAESEVPDVVIIIGQSYEEAGLATEPYETPLGNARVDQVLAREIKKKGNIKVNNPLFDKDEFIESQLPFIQYIYGREKPPKILPLILNVGVDLRNLAVDIKETLSDQDKKAVIVTPSNFTRFGRNYNYIPFSTDVVKQVYGLDKGAIDALTNKDPKEYLEYITKHSMNSENYLGIAFTLLLADPKQVLLEQYYTSADINKDYKNFISFASMILK